MIIKLIKKDYYKVYDSARQSRGKIAAFCESIREPGFQAVCVFRITQYISRKPLPLRVLLMPLQIFLNDMVKICWGIDIGKTAQIGEGLRIEHFGNIIISREARIGKNVNISQGVTIGLSGKGKKQGVPAIGNDVFIAPGAKLFGKITIGNNVKIGANAIVHKDIPDNAIVVSAPGFKIISFAGNHEISEPLT